MLKIFIVRLGLKVLKFELAKEAIIIFVKSIKKSIVWYVHFITKSIIRTVIHLPNFTIVFLTSFNCISINY